MLEVERELARVREEIERYEGRLRYLSAHASMSSLTISIHEPLPIQGPYRGIARHRRRLSSGPGATS